MLFDTILHTFLLLPAWLQPEYLLVYGGISLLLLIVFIENGMFFGFFLPGDSLLFTAGLLCGTEFLPYPLLLIIVLLIASAGLGSWFGYWFGGKFGSRIRRMEDGRFYKQKYLIQTGEFYKERGSFAFIIGRFMPVVRTFIPILAGLIHMPFKRFFLLNWVGVIIWVTVMTLSGFFMGQIFPNIIDYLEWVILTIVIVSFLPLIKTWISRKTAAIKEAKRLNPVK